MQAGDPNKTIDKSRIALVVGLAASIAFTAILYSLQAGQLGQISSDLAAKTSVIEQQEQQISEQRSLVASQQQEISDKTTQLESLEGEIDTLAAEIELQERQMTSRTAQIERLQADLAANNSELTLLQQQAADLEQEIATLQSEIQVKDQDLAELILANAAARRVHVTHYGLGVNEDDEGIVFPIEIEVIGSGGGRISVDVSNVQYAASFQTAVRTAAEVASDYTGVTMSNKDVIVRLVNESDDVIRVDGPSAGAVIAVMLVAGLEEKQLDPDILVTGAIESDGTIGSVGGLQGKADAAADYGAEKLLVPGGQEFHNSRIEIEGVEDIGDLADRIIID